MATITLPAGSSSTDLQTAINSAGSGDSIVLSGNLDFLAAVTVPAGLTLTIQSGAGQAWALRQTVAERHFLVLGDLTLSSLILDGQAAGTGVARQGGLLVTGSLTLMDGTIIQACRAENGGAVAVAGGSLTMDSGTISNNTALKGGGVHLSDASFAFRDGTIGHNTAQNNGGGGVYIDNGGRLEMRAGSIIGNQVSYDSGIGGGVAVTAGGYFLLSGGLIRENSLNLSGNQGGVGGGVCVSGGSFEMTQGVISRNQSQQYGAGVGVSAGGAFTMSGGLIAENVAEAEGGGNKLSGGGVAVINGVFTMHGGDIADNQAVYGGGVHLGYAATSCQFVMSGGSIEGNYASSFGGGVHSQSATASVSIGSAESTGQPQISNNRSGYYGGGISNFASSVTTYDAQIRDNRAVYGGGLWLDDSATATITGATAFRDNTASADGGGIFTGDYDDSDPASITAYQNLTTAATTLFRGNRAAEAYEPPSNAAAFANLGYAASSITDSGGALHPLNNYDINYQGSAPLAVYAVIYNANGGLGDYLDTGLVLGTEYTVLSPAETGISRPGYSFAGWNSEPDGGGAYYEPGQPLLIIGDLLLYAQWTLIQGPYDVIYNANGGNGSYADTDLPDGMLYTLRTPEQTGISRAGYSFSGWNTEPEGSGTAYQPGEEIVIHGNLILYAQWQALPGNSYQVLYCPNCCACVNPCGHADAGLSSGTGYLILSPAQTGIRCPSYCFVGWNSQPDGSGTTYQPGQVIVIEADLILYAQWRPSWKLRHDRPCNPC